MRRKSAKVVVFTDSTAYLPDALQNVTVVPLQVTIGERTGPDGEITSAQVVEALHRKLTVTTSRPSPAEFATAFRAALDAGADHVVSVHLSSRLSGTWESAVLAAQDFGHGVIRVVDSRSTGAALGFAVRSAQRCAEAGGTPAAVQDAAVRTVDRTRTYFYVDTLEFLRRGGRVGAAAAMMATSLSVKPLLHMLDGQIVPLEKVRTSSKAIARLVQLTVAAAGSAEVEVAVQHLGAPERANATAEQLRAQIPHLQNLYIAELSPVVGAHLGPGGLGTVVSKSLNN
ncbi:EDD domain protein, DegV family [Frankineae bacterium MT45]|nr:EDD domain protein, DegV family [Frankineae bacterium MT45]